MKRTESATPYCDGRFLLPVLIFLLGAAVERWSPAAVAQEEQNRYNILFISVDDLRPELGAYGRSYVRTPNIDRLAERGATFFNHYVQAPTCGVSRYALLTGQSPAHSGVRVSNRAMYRGRHAFRKKQMDGAQTMPELFRRSGYHTVCIGKISHTPDGRVYRYDGSGSGRPELPNAWDELATPLGPWDYGWGAFFAYPDGKHREADGGPRNLFNFRAEKDTDLPDGLMAQRAVQKLEELKNRDEPFFMGLGFYKPHLPFVAPKKDRDAVAEWDVPATPHPEKPGSAYWHSSAEFYGYSLPFPISRPLPERARMITRRSYLACVRYVDRQVGKVTDALRRTGLADSTIVVLWGDHGWYLGEYALWGKHTLLERATKSPLIIRHPGLENGGSDSHALVETIDIYPTLIDLANPAFTRTHEPLNGTSLVPLLRDETDRVHRGAVSYWNKTVSVRTRNFRLVTTGIPGHMKKTELYDLRDRTDSDPVAPDTHPDVLRRMKEILRERLPD